VFAVASNGRVVTSDEYGCCGSHDTPLSAIVSGNDRPLIVQYVSCFAVTS
jgi:GR25 family glycosyltransferase involved in LPS biosynthesis